MFKRVTNLSKVAAAVVADRTIGIGESKDLPAKQVEKWLAKGGKRLVDNKTIDVQDVDAAQVVAAPAQAAPFVPADESADPGSKAQADGQGNPGGDTGATGGQDGDQGDQGGSGDAGGDQGDQGGDEGGQGGQDGGSEGAKDDASPKGGKKKK